MAGVAGISSLDAAYVFNNGILRLEYISSEPYRFAGSRKIDTAKENVLSILITTSRTTCIYRLSWL